MIAGTVSEIRALLNDNGYEADFEGPVVVVPKEQIPEATPPSPRPVHSLPSSVAQEWLEQVRAM